MPNAQHHLIESQRVEVRLESRAHAADVQERLSRLANRALFRETEEICSRVCPPEFSYRVPRLVLDLGTLSLGHLEEEFMARFKTAFLEAVAGLLASAATWTGTSQPGGVTRHPAGAPADALAHLLEHGSMPWWVADGAALPLETLLLAFLERRAAETVATIRRLGHSAAVRRRLVLQLSPAALARLLEALEPADAAFILGYEAEVKRRQQQTREAPADTREFHEATWELILETVLVTRGSRFNRKEFLRGNIRGLAQHFRISYHALLRHLARPADLPGATRPPPTLIALLRELHEELSGDSPPANGGGGTDAASSPSAALLEQALARCFPSGADGNAAPEPGSDAARRRLAQARLRQDPQPAFEWLQRWLRGAPGCTPLSGAALPGGPEMLLARLQLHHPAATADFLHQTLADAAVLRAVLKRAAPGLRRRLLAGLAPRAASLLDAYLSTVTEHRAALLGRAIGRRQFEVETWFTLLHGLTQVGEPSGAGVNAALQAHWQEAARRHGVTPELLLERWQALVRIIFPRRAPAMAAWARALARSGGKLPLLSSAPAPEAVRAELTARLGLWQRLLDPTAQPKLKDREVALLWTAADRDAPFLYSELLDASAPDAATLTRLVATGGEAFLLRVATGESAAWRTEFMEWLDVIEKIGMRAAIFPFSAREWRGRALGELVQFRRVAPVRTASPGTVVLEILLRLGIHAHAVGHWQRALDGAPPGTLPGFAEWRALPQEQALAVLLQGWMAREPRPVTPRVLLTLQRAIAVRHRPPAPKTKPKPAARGPRHPLYPEPPQPVFIENAGLVLLAPFFGRYHETNGLLADGLFRDEAAAERGAHLLQALLTDNQPVPEQFLVLNKVLCGLPPATPVAYSVEYTPNELATAHTLLRSAAAAWRGAGSLSHEGLRNSFLKRRGKLVRGPERWTLTVEQRAYDVLLSSLPWGYSVVKPRWMPDPLYVEWI